MIYFSENCPGTFYFFNLFQEIPDKTKLYSTKLCQIPQKFQGQKQRLMEILHYFFLVTLGNSTSFLINPRNSMCYFFDAPGNSISSAPLFVDFFRMEQPNCFSSYIWLFFIIYQKLLLTRHVIPQASRESYGPN